MAWRAADISELTSIATKGDLGLTLKWALCFNRYEYTCGLLPTDQISNPGSMLERGAANAFQIRPVGIQLAGASCEVVREQNKAFRVESACDVDLFNC